MKFFSINCTGFSTFLKTDKDLSEDDSDDVVSEAIKQNLMDSDDAKLVFNVTEIDEAEYNRAMKA